MCIGVETDSGQRAHVSASFEKHRSMLPALVEQTLQLAVYRQPPLTLVLDVDETLLRCRIEGYHSGRKLAKVDATQRIEISAPNGELAITRGCDLSFRPGLADFLSWIRKRRVDGAIEGPWLFSAGEECYIQAVLKEIDPDGDLFGDRLLTKEDCTPCATPGMYLKDLSRVPSLGGTARTILVDNSPVSCVLNPESSILIHDWLADGEHDTELYRVMSLVDDALARGGVAGNYANLISSITMGHAMFMKNLADLRDVISAEPADHLSLMQTLKARLEQVHDVKKQFLGDRLGCA